MTTADTEAIKERERSSWKSVADGWKRRDELLKKGAAPVTEWMLSHAELAEGHHVLDVASGTGEPAISAALRIGPTGRVTGTDLVDEMLAYARQKAAHAGLDNIVFNCMDGEQLEFTANTFDAVTFRWGLMFMPEPEACLDAIHKAMKPGGRITLACWSTAEKNPFISLLMNTLGTYIDLPKPPPGAPGLFSFSDPDRLHGILGNAGFTDIELEELVINFIEVDCGQSYWETMSDLAAPIMLLVEQLDADSRARFIEDVVNTADDLKQDGVLRLQGTTWVASARA
jgi:ubiquinone/menaquinone biosynthesis C-methylase UbiE